MFSTDCWMHHWEPVNQIWNTHLTISQTHGHLYRAAEPRTISSPAHRDVPPLKRERNETWNPQVRRQKILRTSQTVGFYHSQQWSTTEGKYNYRAKVRCGHRLKLLTPANKNWLKYLSIQKVKKRKLKRSLFALSKEKHIRLCLFFLEELSMTLWELKKMSEWHQESRAVCVNTPNKSLIVKCQTWKKQIHFPQKHLKEPFDCIKRFAGVKRPWSHTFSILLTWKRKAYDHLSSKKSFEIRWR